MAVRSTVIAAWLAVARTFAGTANKAAFWGHVGVLLLALDTLWSDAPFVLGYLPRGEKSGAFRAFLLVSSVVRTIVALALFGVYFRNYLGGRRFCEARVDAGIAVGKICVYSFIRFV